MFVVLFDFLWRIIMHMYVCTYTCNVNPRFKISREYISFAKSQMYVCVRASLPNGSFFDRCASLSRDQRDENARDQRSSPCALERLLYANDRTGFLFAVSSSPWRAIRSRIYLPRLRDCDVVRQDSSFQLLPPLARVIRLKAFDARISFLPRSCGDWRPGARNWYLRIPRDPAISPNDISSTRRDLIVRWWSLSFRCLPDRSCL